MEVYLRAFVNFKQNNWAKLLPMAEFAYNNAKSASTGHTPFELNCGYHSRMSYEEDIDPRSKSKSVYKLSAKPWELISVCQETTLKNFRSKLTIEALSLRAMLQVIKFDWIVNISKPNKTGSWKRSFLDRFGSYILLESKFIS